MRLKDKIALITGAAGGIGRATALRFAEEGAVLVLSDINEEGALASLAAAGQQGGRGMAVRTDVTKEADIVGLFARVKQEYGRLDILANIAGGDFEPMTAFEDISYEGLSYNIDVNLKSCILCCREAAKIMVPQRYGKIINMSSLVHRGSPVQFTYAAAKGGVYSFNRTMALVMGMHNINVNALAPALVEVPAIKNAIGPEMWEALRQDCANRYPLGRVAQPLDVANCALFLASDESSFITGQIIEISGGARL